MWRPGASIETLKERDQIIRKIRHFFYERGLIEVETPILANYTVTDPYLDSLSTKCNSKSYYLQTSPEYHMKRLLAAGIGDSFQFCKSFRDNEEGQLHNVEFTMLEWYRVGWSDEQLMKEMESLMISILPVQRAEYYSYQEIFKKILGLNVESSSIQELQAIVKEKNWTAPDLGSDKKDWLLFLFSNGIEPNLQALTFIFDFPASQAALAKIKANACAARFELYYKGVELANGFGELTDPKEQVLRFEANLAVRREKNLAPLSIDPYFISALEYGLPVCSGVALGVDRLIMLALKKKDLSEVMSFSLKNA